MKAIVIGATGAVGKDLVELLLADESVEQVHIFVRRDPQLGTPAKLVTHVVVFNEPQVWQHLVQGDVAFSCMGTTLKAAGSQAAQYTVDYTYQFNFAEAAARNQVPALVLLSSAMANAQSRLFYTRIKGELEVAVAQLGFKQLCIVRPPSLIRKGTDRLNEKIANAVLSFFNALGLFKQQRPMPTHIVAQCMVAVAKNGCVGTLEPEEIWAEGDK